MQCFRNCTLSSFWFDFIWFDRGWRRGTAAVLASSSLVATPLFSIYCLILVRNQLLEIAHNATRKLVILIIKLICLFSFCYPFTRSHSRSSHCCFYRKSFKTSSLLWTSLNKSTRRAHKGPHTLTSFLVPVAGASQLAPVNWRVCHATGTSRL